MSDTPETDAAILTEPFYVCQLPFEVVRVDVCGKLERELNEANKELNKIYIEYDALFDEAAQIRIERDAAKELIREIRDNESNAVDEATKFLRDYPINEHNK